MGLYIYIFDQQISMLHNHILVNAITYRQYILPPIYYIYMHTDTTTLCSLLPEATANMFSWIFIFSADVCMRYGFHPRALWQCQGFWDVDIYFNRETLWDPAETMWLFEGIELGVSLFCFSPVSVSSWLLLIVVSCAGSQSWHSETCCFAGYVSLQNDLHPKETVISVKKPGFVSNI